MKTVNSKNWTAEDVQEILDLMAMLDVVSLNALTKPVDGDNPTEIGEFIIDDAPGPQEIVEKQEANERLLELVNKLPPRDSQVIKLRYGLINRKPMTLEQIGQLYGVTRERIRQIECKALKRLHWLITVKCKCRKSSEF